MWTSLDLSICSKRSLNIEITSECKCLDPCSFVISRLEVGWYFDLTTLYFFFDALEEHSLNRLAKDRSSCRNVMMLSINVQVRCEISRTKQLKINITQEWMKQKKDTTCKQKLFLFLPSQHQTNCEVFVFTHRAI